MNDVIPRISMALQLLTKKDLVVFMCEPHRVMADGTLEADSQILINDDLNPELVTLAGKECNEMIELTFKPQLLQNI